MRMDVMKMYRILIGGMVIATLGVTAYAQEDSVPMRYQIGQGEQTQYFQDWMTPFAVQPEYSVPRA